MEESWIFPALIEIDGDHLFFHRERVLRIALYNIPTPAICQHIPTSTLSDLGHNCPTAPTHRPYPHGPVRLRTPAPSLVVARKRFRRSELIGGGGE